MHRLTWNLAARLTALAALAALTGCDEAASAAVTDASTPTADSTGDSATAARGPLTITIDGDPNGIWWSAAAQTLYLADDNNNRILTWRDGTGFGQAWPLLAAPATGSGLGGLVAGSDGKLWVTRFGNGTDGAVLWVDAGGITGKVPNLDPVKRRLGMAVDSAGNLYDSWFIKTASDRVGTVARLDPAGTETPLVSSGLQKPVGLLVKGAHLYFDDQETHAVLRCALPECKEVESFGNVTTPDLMSDGPGDAVLVSSHEGVVVAVRPSVANQIVASGLQQPHGLAYDPAHKRLFIADHDPSAADGEVNTLHIVPLD